MATINDFKIVNQYSEKYFDLIGVDTDVSSDDKKRFGFYLLALESITGNTDIDELLTSIIDTEFCSIVHNKKNNDFGVDAVYIDEEEKIVKLFNFKFKKKFSVQRGQNERNILDSSKFLLQLKSGSFDKLDTVTKNKMLKIQEKFNSDEIWKTKLYLVSNDSIKLEPDNDTVRLFYEEYDIKPISITLDDIVSFISDRPNDISASFLVDSNSVLTYEENDLSSSKSYLVKLPVSDVMRITSDSALLREDYSLNDLSKLSDVKLELGVLYDNVRGYLGETKFNKNILNTLDREPSKFFMYNNGITITATDIIMRAVNGQTKYQCVINGLQVVNGGQTIRTIYEFKENNFDETKLASAEVLVRIFKTEQDQILTNNIAEYTNSQNSISSVDLKSISNLQIQIEKYLRSENILYVRKAGTIEEDIEKFSYRISMERLAQIIYAYQGYPDRSTNQKSQLFDRYYDDIFNEEKMELELFVRLIKLYYDIENTYYKTNYESYVQKFFYVIFLKSKLPEEEIEALIEMTENTLKEYRKEDDLSDARKLIQKGFRVKLEETTAR